MHLTFGVWCSQIGRDTALFQRQFLWTMAVSQLSAGLAGLQLPAFLMPALWSSFRGT